MAGEEGRRRRRRRRSRTREISSGSVRSVVTSVVLMGRRESSSGEKSAEFNPKFRVMGPDLPRSFSEAGEWSVGHTGKMERRSGMGIFATLTRRGAHADAARSSEADGPWAEGVGYGVPSRFEAVVEHLGAGRDATRACAEVGRELARDGAALGEALDGLQATYAHVIGGEPDFRATRALCEAWGEETLGYLHQLSCEDPLTGLVSLAHLQARVSEVYRGASRGDVAGQQPCAGARRPPLARPALGVERPVRGHACDSCGWPRRHGRLFPVRSPSPRPALRGWSS